MSEACQMPNPPSRKGRDAWCQMILETKVLELKKDCYEAGHQKMEDCVACVRRNSTEHMYNFTSA